MGKKAEKKKAAQAYPTYRDIDAYDLYVGNTGTLFMCQSKRMVNVYPLLLTNENLAHSAYTAQKGKGDRTEIKQFEESICENLMRIYTELSEKTWVPGEYKKRWIQDPKERLIMIAPYRDRVVHHIVINVLWKHWQSLFIANTYACIKGRGTHLCMLDVHKALQRDKRGTRYCLKIDIRKFYDNIDHAALKRIIRKTIADEDLLWLLDTIIDSNGEDKGLPIGNFTSQYLANLYLAYFDHWVKETLHVKHYFRYMDDIVVLAESKEYLHDILDKFALYLGAELKVEIKPNWQIFPVDDRCIDFVGFKQNHNDILLRVSILKRFYKKLNATKKKYQIKDESDFKHAFPSEYGWIIRCSEKHKTFIFNKVIDNGKFGKRAVGEDQARENREAQQRARHSILQPQHQKGVRDDIRNGRREDCRGRSRRHSSDVAVRQIEG